MNILHATTDPDHLTRLKEILDRSARADIAAPVNYRQNKHSLFCAQERLCAGCRVMLPCRNLTACPVSHRNYPGGHLPITETT